MTLPPRAGRTVEYRRKAPSVATELSALPGMAEGSDVVGSVMSISEWPSNAELIRDCARLGYLRENWRTLDPTYGYGTFWKLWRPHSLIASDLNPTKSQVEAADFRALPWPGRSFDSVVFDPPYKLNGNPSDTNGVDERYGADERMDWRARLELIRLGVIECARILADGYLLVKCQDQVCSGKMRWQTDLVTDAARGHGLGKVDRFDILSYRPQPDGRSQRHARHNASQLLVFKRGW